MITVVVREIDVNGKERTKCFTNVSRYVASNSLRGFGQYKTCYDVDLHLEVGKDESGGVIERIEELCMVVSLNAYLEGSIIDNIEDKKPPRNKKELI